MNQQAAQRAIKAALARNWNEAIEFNLQILQTEPDNIEALNRLAKSYVSIGQTKNAKKTWNRVLRIDRYNPIATTQLEKLKSASPNNPPKNISTKSEIFLDEPGKTTTTKLAKIADKKTLANLEPGQIVNLVPKKRFVTVKDQNNTYLGNLPDDLSIHLSLLIKSGNKYETLIRRVEKNSLYVFIKEVKKSKKHQNTPSFPSRKQLKIIRFENATPISSIPINITPTGEEEEYK